MTIEEIERITDLFNSPDKDNTTVAVSYLENLDLKKDLVDILLTMKNVNALELSLFNENWIKKLFLHLNYGNIHTMVYIPSFVEISKHLLEKELHHSMDNFSYYVNKFVKEVVSTMHIGEIIEDIEVKVILKNITKLNVI